MSKLIWLKNVSRRTLIAFLPFLAKEDIDLAKEYLTESEYILYKNMDIRDRDHAFQVAKAVIRNKNYSPELVRAAFLHDVGKSGASYNPIERIAVHLIKTNNIPINAQVSGLKAAIQRKNHHAEYGARLIKDKRVAELVRRHHEPKGDSEAEVLKAIEEVF